MSEPLNSGQPDRMNLGTLWPFTVRPTYNGVGLATLNDLINPTSIVMNGRFQLKQGPSVASANNIVVGDGNFFLITGNTQINTISAADWQPGSVIILQFASNPLVSNNAMGAGASILLTGGVNFQTSANAILTLIYNGTNWCELARTVF